MEHLCINGDENDRRLPSSVNFPGCQGSSHRAHDRAQHAGHAVQVVNPAGVLDLQFLLQDGLNGGEGGVDGGACQTI